MGSFLSAHSASRKPPENQNRLLRSLYIPLSSSTFPIPLNTLNPNISYFSLAFCAFPVLQSQQHLFSFLFSGWRLKKKDDDTAWIQTLSFWVLFLPEQSVRYWDYLT
ncbi:hypothetical protein SLA2020_468220 [Shorea laevis]